MFSMKRVNKNKKIIVLTFRDIENEQFYVKKTKNKQTNKKQHITPSVSFHSKKDIASKEITLDMETCLLSH